MRKLAALLLCLLLQPVCDAGQKGFVKDGLAEDLDDLMNRYTADGYSGAVLVARNGEIILHKGYGLADRERKIQNTPATLFHVASVGKIFTAAAVLKLEMEGRLRTADLISKHLGPFPEEKRGATIHHLLTHTAGLASESVALDYSSRRAFVRSMKEAPLDFKPGANYRYSNAGYTLLAAVVEEVSGQPFEAYLQKELFDPAGLTETGYAWDARFNDSPVAVGYEGDRVAELRPTPRVRDRWGLRGPGNLITTVGDLYRWTRALADNKVLSEQARKKMFTVYAHGDEGYGWHVAKTERGTTMLRRGGGRDDFESELRWYVDEDVTVIFTVNNDLSFRRVVAPAIERTIWRR